MKNTRCMYLGLLLIVYMGVNLATRAALAMYAGPEAIGGWVSLVPIFGMGTLNDLLPFFLMTLPLAGLVLLPKTRIAGRASRLTLAGLFCGYVALFLFTALAEGLFWDEFHCRFNFIAVDYLVYSSEVIGNIMESYPVISLVGGVGVVAVLLSWLVLYSVRVRLCQGGQSVFPVRAVFGLWLGVAALSLIVSPLVASGNKVNRELAANGVWSLFAAFRHNQLDYRQFYPVVSEQDALRVLREELTEPDAVFFSDSSTEWRRHISSQKPEQRLNVIQIVVESLGSAALGPSTPNLNALASQSLRFSSMKATGTRTVRGIEALTLSLPPTPGASIVRRPSNEGLFNLGGVFRQRGYDTAFIYGGYGYFDNMNAFFAGNGFRIVDRSVIPDEHKTFGNAWGVCDEDLLDAALREADTQHAEGKPFYQFVLTTSNHRPFTYPDGKVDVPSGTSRTGAIKYTDYALGRFLREAATRPWFANTVFVIVADHTAGSAGKTDIPPEAYDIPCLIYSPRHVAARNVDTLCSQIDVAPTLLALLGWKYDSTFFGKNVLTMLPEQGRAWIGTYQLLGRLTSQGLVVLEPLKAARVEGVEGLVSGTVLSSSEAALALPAIAGYQTAQDVFMSNVLRGSEESLAYSQCLTCRTASATRVESWAVAD